MCEIGVNIISGYKTIMIRNRIFRVSEIVPHPNYNIEMGKSNQPIFLESFPEVKLCLIKWARSNVTNSNCVSIGVQLRQTILPITYKTYLKESTLDNHQPLYINFLKLFHLKSISDSTIWRWMRKLGFQYSERKKNYYCDKHEESENEQSTELQKKKIEDKLTLICFFEIGVNLEGFWNH